MAAARTSIAMGAGSDITPQTADGFTVRDELHTIPTIKIQPREHHVSSGRWGKCGNTRSHC